MYVTCRDPVCSSQIRHDNLQVLASPANARRRSTIKDHEGSLESNITKDVDTNCRAGLQASEAGSTGSVDGSKVHVATRNDDASRANTECEVWGRSRTWVDVPSGGSTVGRPGDLLPVGRDNSSGEVEEGGAGISDAADGSRSKSSRADGVSG